jgi:hypothetical protein
VGSNPRAPGILQECFSSLLDAASKALSHPRNTFARSGIIARRLVFRGALFSLLCFPNHLLEFFSRRREQRSSNDSELIPLTVIANATEKRQRNIQNAKEKGAGPSRSMQPEDHSKARQWNRKH